MFDYDTNLHKTIKDVSKRLKYFFKLFIFVNNILFIIHINIMIRYFSISEIKYLIKESTRKRLLPCEQSDINQQIVLDHELGYEAVLTDNGKEKVLLPEDGAVVYLFRGQNQEYIPCYPSLYREIPRPLTESEIFTWKMRFILFCDMLDTYPIVDKFFKRQNFKVDYEGLAQHYGLLTSVLDLTSNIDIAFFFATCWYDRTEDCYKPFDDGKEHEGILYVFCPLMANEPIPVNVDDFMKENITPIGLQPFLRPARQKGYALHIPKGKSIKCWVYRFKFSNEESLVYYNLFNGGRNLWIYDTLAEKAKRIRDIRNFSYMTFNRTYEKFSPKGFSRTKLKKMLVSDGISFAKHAETVFFSEEEKNEVIKKWNSGEGKQFCESIGRRSWYEIIDEHETISARKGEYKLNLGSIHPYRTLKMLAEKAWLGMLAHPEGPDEAEWINYKNTPNETHQLFIEKEQVWTKVPGRIVHLFAKNYLKEEDYFISD